MTNREPMKPALGYLCATWSKTAQRAAAGNPLKWLVSALGLEPRTLCLKDRHFLLSLLIDFTALEAALPRAAREAARAT